MVLVWQSSCFWANVVVFGQKWLYFCQSACIRLSLFYSGRAVVFGKQWFYSAKVVVFGKSGRIRAKVVIFGKI